MSYLSKKEALSAISRRTKTVNGKVYETYEVYLGVNPITNKQVRICRSDKKELRDVVESFYNDLRRAGDAGATLTASQSYDAIQAIHALSDAKIDITLTECVRKLIAFKVINSNTPFDKTVGDAFAEYLESFAEGSTNRKIVSSRVGRWTYAFGKSRPMTDITEVEVLDWISTNYSVPKTYNNHLTYIRTFFNWCTQKNRRYLIENPLECAKKKPIEAKRPEFMKSTDVKDLLRVLEKNTKKPELLAYAVTSFFCGIRREEILRGANDEQALIFDFQHRTVIVVKVKRFTQGAHPRSFPMNDAFYEWATSFDFKTSFNKITEEVVEYIRDIARKNDIYFPKNAGRHTFITQMLALTQDEHKTCQMAGTSPQMVKDNYNGLSFADDATAFFAIRPSLHT